MKNTLILICIIYMISSGCIRSSEHQINESLFDSVSIRPDVSSTAAVENNKDSTHKFVRSAELKFKVKNVISATYAIENITARQGGFVTYTNLTSNINTVSTIPISTDSSLETKYYTVINTITLRVPNTRLDSTLKEIAGNIDFLDFRIIKAEDVALQLYANDLTHERVARNAQRLTTAIDQKGKKLHETASAELSLLDKAEQSDNARLSNLSLKDQIKFSNISLTIYQRETTSREMIGNDKNIEAYQPGMGKRLLESFIYGWGFLEDFVVYLVKSWGIILFIILALFIYKFLQKKFKK